MILEDQALSPFEPILDQLYELAQRNGISADEEIQDVFRFVCHLYDILVRIVFKRLGYDLTYQPRVLRFTTDMTVDWVRTDTTASALGY